MRKLGLNSLIVLVAALALAVWRMPAWSRASIFLTVYALAYGLSVCGTMIATGRRKQLFLGFIVCGGVLVFFAHINMIGSSADGLFDKTLLRACDSDNLALIKSDPTCFGDLDEEAIDRLQCLRVALVGSFSVLGAAISASGRLYGKIA